MASGSLTRLFTLRSIAVIAALHDPALLGYGLVRNLVHSKYRRAVHFVNPKRGRLLGRPVYSSIVKIPEPVDLAILLIPTRYVLGVLKECGIKGVIAIVNESGGFRETGEAGAALENERLQLARMYGKRILVHSSIGLLDTHLLFDVTFLPPPGPLPGGVVFISCSDVIKPPAQREVNALSQAIHNCLLEASEISMILYRLATSTDEIAEMVNSIDYLTVLKVVALDGVHKSDLCGVLLNLKSPKEEEKGYAAVICNLQDSRPEMYVQGVLVQPMLS